MHVNKIHKFAEGIGYLVAAVLCISLIFPEEQLVQIDGLNKKIAGLRTLISVVAMWIALIAIGLFSLLAFLERSPAAYAGAAFAVPAGYMMTRITIKTVESYISGRPM